MRWGGGKKGREKKGSGKRPRANKGVKMGVSGKRVNLRREKYLAGSKNRTRQQNVKHKGGTGWGLQNRCRGVKRGKKEITGGKVYQAFTFGLFPKTRMHFTRTGGSNERQQKKKENEARS